MKLMPDPELPQLATIRVATVSVATSAKAKLKKSSKFHLTGISLPFQIFRAKCAAHISTRRITTIHIGLLFWLRKGEIVFALLNATCVHNSYQK
jgi:hypothetical protein